MLQLSHDEIRNRVYDRAAWVLQQSWEEGWRHSRLLDEPLIPNHIILAGHSVAGAEYREHVVPLALIRDHCEKMFACGAELRAVSMLLRRHLRVVMISKAERYRIDFELGLKVRMPDGWSFEDDGADPFARLKAAGVEWEAIRHECL
ncbi:hypothetical protein [Novosphingobium sp.]|uniref:hypothetical protein n=1 Tax=Novosphingobium sp. TaxID=1874826 RepID=UPI002736B593|nr:hypothetical protein [Novosphingobium sp.]MDP3906157.1 hypothetical protein [Novosphingobium sp.]